MCYRFSTDLVDSLMLYSVQNDRHRILQHQSFGREAARLGAGILGVPW